MLGVNSTACGEAARGGDACSPGARQVLRACKGRGDARMELTACRGRARARGVGCCRGRGAEPGLGAGGAPAIICSCRSLEELPEFRRTVPPHSNAPRQGRASMRRGPKGSSRGTSRTHVHTGQHAPAGWRPDRERSAQAWNCWNRHRTIYERPGARAALNLRRAWESSCAQAARIGNAAVSAVA